MGNFTYICTRVYARRVIVAVAATAAPVQLFSRVSRVVLGWLRILRPECACVWIVFCCCYGEAVLLGI